jgi:two-component system, OmpR family, response regulator
MADPEGMFSCPYCFSLQRKEAYVKDGRRRYRCASCGCPVEDTTVQTMPSIFHRTKVLFVDDDPLLLVLLKAAMREHSFDVLTAPDGPTGIELARKERPEIVVVDVLMPRMSGFDFCRRLRAEPGFRRTPLILVSARPDPALEQKGLAAGANIAVPKPADLDELAQLLRQALTRRTEPDHA